MLGPGLLESIYLGCLQFELSERGLRFEAQKPVPVVYKSIRLSTVHRIDLLIEDSVIVEVKSVDALVPVHQAQLLTYLRLTGCRAGLLVNFNVPKLTDGVRRLLNHIGEGARVSALAESPHAADDERESKDGEKRWDRKGL